MTYYLPAHASQYGADRLPITRTSGCTWTSARTAADAATKGAVNRTPDQVHALVKPSEETNATTPGWSLHDAQLALTRLGVKSENHSGEGWASLVHYRAQGYGILLQGDSDRFPDGCSGAFDGDHCIFVHPAGSWRIDDPICPVATTQPEATLRAYAEKFYAGVSFLVVFPVVPQVTPVPTKFRVLITGPVRLYSRIEGTLIGTVTKATYTCTRTKRNGRWWYRIVVGPRTGQAFKANGARMTVRPL